jgi:hypothetical protein
MLDSHRVRIARLGNIVQDGVTPGAYIALAITTLAALDGLAAR